MVVLDIRRSNILREKYISTFVDTDSKLYIERIKTRIRFSDGMCYVGYLWDCLKKSVVVSKKEIDQKLKTKKDIYIMWDIHSADNIFIPNYWKYPKECIVRTKLWIEEMYKELPEDVYIFDDTFTWTAIFTHETNLENAPYCLFVDKVL